MTVRRTKLDEEPYDLGSLRLYREDLYAIATAVAEAGELRISCDGIEADSPGDFDELPENLAKLTITATRTDPPRAIEVSLAVRGAAIKLTEPSTETRAILIGIRQICEPRRLPWRSRIPRSPNAGIAVMLIGIMAFAFGFVAVAEIVAPSKGATNWITNPAVIPLASVVLLAALGYLALDSRPRVVIINAPRADRPTYWQETGNGWWIAIVTMVIGTTAGYLLAKFT